jgi:glutamate-1-semialdehyde 2,1-aminomutase
MVQAAARVDSDKPATGASVLVGATNSAFPIPLTGCIARGQGARVWDDNGREYVDFVLSSGPMILGHSHPAVVEAVARQVSNGFAFNVLNQQAIDLAASIVAIPGCVELVRFASTGTEATMHAIRLARAYTGRDRVLVFGGSYHGSHDVSLVGHRGALKAAGGGVPQSVIADTLIAGFGDMPSVEAAFSRHGGEIAAVLIEPQQRSVDPPPGFLEDVAKITRANGAVFIFDEVLTGFRLAYGGAQEYYGVTPDVLCYGKIVGGGFPLSAIAGRREIMRLADPALAESPEFVHVSGTLSGNPISAAAGLATLQQLEQPGVYEYLHALGSRLRDGLRGQIEVRGIEGAVVGSGPIAAVRFGDGRSPEAMAMRRAVNREIVRRGILAQLQTRFYLSLAHTEADVGFCTEVFGEALEAATA